MHRASLNEINGIEVDGNWHSAGIVKDTRSSAEIRTRLPLDLSLSWVTLKDNENLEPHFHPIESYVAILKNCAFFHGDKLIPLETGDVVCIPSNMLHSFSKGPIDSPFWGIAWNTTLGHLFQGNLNDRLVFFKNEQKCQSIIPASKINLFRDSSTSLAGLKINGFQLQPQKEILIGPTPKSWLIIAESCFSDELRNNQFTEGDLVLIDNNKVVLKNTSEMTKYFYIFSVI